MPPRQVAYLEAEGHAKAPFHKGTILTNDDIPIGQLHVFRSTHEGATSKVLAINHPLDGKIK